MDQPEAADDNRPGSDPGNSLQPESNAGASSPNPFEGIRVPEPINASPPLQARVLALAGVLLGGALGGLIGYGVADLLSGGDGVMAAVGFLVGAIGCAIGVGIIVSLTLRAMNEWNAVKHPDEAS